MRCQVWTRTAKSLAPEQHGQLSVVGVRAVADPDFLWLPVSVLPASDLPESWLIPIPGGMKGKNKRSPRRDMKAIC